MDSNATKTLNLFYGQKIGIDTLASISSLHPNFHALQLF